MTIRRPKRHIDMKQILLLISLFLLPVSNGQVFSATDVVSVVLNSQVIGATIPEDYSGLSYETRMMLPDANGQYYFSKENQKLVRMFKRLGVKSLRLGGNSVDVNSTSYPSNKDIDALFGFAREAGVKVIYSALVVMLSPRPVPPVFLARILSTR